MKGKKLIVISGPTASGKTGKAIEWARQYNTSILSFDSRQCYQEMPIGTAQPSLAEQQGIPHYFIASHNIHDHISAAYYERYALEILHNLFSKHTEIIAVGGTGLYLKALLYGLDEMPMVNESIEQALIKLYQQEGIEALQQQLKEKDPTYYSQGEIQNPHRVIRALGFVLTHQKSITHFQKGKRKKRFFEWEHFSLELPRKILYEKINERVDQMMKKGLLQEVKELLPFQSLKALQTVGYTELFSYLNGEITQEAAIEKIKQHTRNYAKRQITWFKKMEDIQFIHP